MTDDKLAELTPDDQERLDAITNALAGMVRRQTDLERRLERLEEVLKVPRPAPADAPPALPIAAPPPTDPSPKSGIETAFGLTWLSRIGVITVVLALAFFFEYAFENHWITETARIGLGLVSGAVALVFGERLWKSGQRTFGLALTAAGIAFLYLSFWAAFTLYHLVPRPAAFALMLLTTAAAGALAVRYESLAIAVLGLAVGYATPLLLRSDAGTWFVLAYVLVLNLGSAAAVRVRGWRWLEALAFAGTVILFATQMQGPHWISTVFVCLYYAQFAMAPLLPVSVAAQVWAGIVLASMWSPAPGVLALILAIAAAGLAVAEWRNWAAGVSASFAGFWIAYAFWRSGSSAASPALPFLALTAGFLVFLGWLLWRAWRGGNLRLQELLVLALNAALYFGAGYSLLETNYGGYEGLFAVSAALMTAGAARLLWVRDPRGGMLAAGVACALLVLAAPIQLVGYRVTLAWALEAAALTWIGSRLRRQAVVYTGGAVFLLVLLRLVFVDSRMYAAVGSYALLANARFLVYLTAAVSVWAAAWWSRSYPRFALCAYVGGHGVLLWGLGLEVAGWAQRTAEPQNLRSVTSTSISVLVAAYAVMLVAAGVSRRSAVTRVIGMALIGLVVLKLYLYDVWLLGQFYRMTAFAILGVLLLVMSYFYSRFRGSMESWWRP
ncbi:MAG TPA: DUF2339 domain-containing protein [Bryobacteraceae bacterium]